MSIVSPWSAAELRLTKNQAEFLASGISRCWSQKMAANTEASLSRRKMLGWFPGSDGWYLKPNAKGRAALAKYRGCTLIAANDNRREFTNAA